jgi:hypothetical protein
MASFQVRWLMSVNPTVARFWLFYSIAVCARSLTPILTHVLMLGILSSGAGAESHHDRANYQVVSPS